MNTTLKVFIILVLVVSLIFMAIQMMLYATRENWKRRWNEDTAELAKDLKSTSEMLANESARNVKSATLITQFEQQNADQQALLKKQEATISEKDKNIGNLELDISKLRADIMAHKEQIQTLSTQLEQTRTRNNELQHIASVARAVAFQLNVKLAEVEDDLHNSNTTVAKSQQDIAALTKDLNDSKARLALVRDNHPEIYQVLMDDSGSHKFVQGVVAAVNTNPQGQQDLVMLTIGKEEGVEEGLEFIVFRGNQYIVKVRAEKVLNDMVACRVIPETWNATGAQIKVNDLAQNRL
ncbi:MAG: hypothetical protein H0W72_07185 [Planctomycetes bacterium]|nr:hypothetical protein [Planctomycetota bacterium]